MKHTRTGALSWLGDFKILTLTLAVALSGCFLLAGKLQASTIQQWEYKVIAIHKYAPMEEYNRYLNEFGQDGWEMVTVERFLHHGTNDSWRFFFKRPIIEGVTASDSRDRHQRLFREVRDMPERTTNTSVTDLKNLSFENAISDLEKILIETHERLLRDSRYESKE